MKTKQLNLTKQNQVTFEISWLDCSKAMLPPIFPTMIVHSSRDSLKFLYWFKAGFWPNFVYSRKHVVRSSWMAVTTRNHKNGSHNSTVKDRDLQQKLQTPLTLPGPSSNCSHYQKCSKCASLAVMLKIKSGTTTIPQNGSIFSDLNKLLQPSWMVAVTKATIQKGCYSSTR